MRKKDGYQPSGRMNCYVARFAVVQKEFKLNISKYDGDYGNGGRDYNLGNLKIPIFPKLANA